MLSSSPEQASADDSLIGRWILDQYLILKQIAVGGMAEIFLAEQAHMDRKAVIKILRTERGSEKTRLFRQEARAVSRLIHPHIVTVYNFGELADGALFLAMEYVEGQTFGTISTAQPPTAQVLRLALQCAEALSFAHQRGVIHRDLKPDNLIVTSIAGTDCVKVLDFGVARLPDDPSQTQDGTLIGTPKYMTGQ